MEGKTCAHVRAQYYVDPASFSRWNPAISLDCEGWLGGWSYCVEVFSEAQSSAIAAGYISTTTTTSPKALCTTVPTQKPTPPWIDKGCYLATYTDITVLSNKSTVASGSDLTIDKCKAACYAWDFTYAGVELGNECWCGNGIRNEKPDDEAECNMPCSGNPTEICGGTARINVFQAVVPKTYVTYPGTSTLGPTVYVTAPPWTAVTDDSSSTPAMATSAPAMTASTSKLTSLAPPSGSPVPQSQSMGCHLAGLPTLGLSLVFLPLGLSLIF